MRKIRTLIKYELLDLRRGALIWVMALLYIFGVQQTISGMERGYGWFLSIFKLVEISWLPLNLIMIPLMLIAIKIGKSDTEIFKTVDISVNQMFLSRIGTMLIIDFIILAANILVFITIAVISKASLGYIIYQGGGYILNSIIFLLICSILGLIIGQTISKNGGDILSFILIIVLFIALSNFYKTFNIIIPLINIKTFPTSFNVIKYDKSYLYHNVFWIMASLALLSILYTCTFRCEERKKVKNISIGVIILSSIMCIYSGTELYMNSTTFYNIASRKDVNEKEYKGDKTFFIKDDCGYYIDKYNIDLSIGDELKSNCVMDVKINNHDIKTLQFGLYEKLKIDNLKLNGKDIEFVREGNCVKIDIGKYGNKDNSLQLEIGYKGKVNTEWLQGKELFFVRNNSVFLGDVFEWYPKLNDSKLKDYNISVKYDSRNKLYSNLDLEKDINGYKLSGKDREVFLVSGNLKERTYKDYLFIGNEEIINKDESCDILIETSSKKNEDINKNKKIVVAPFIPGRSKMDKDYKNAYLNSFE